MAKTAIILWPAVQLLMDCEGFREHSALCGSEPFYSEHGDSAYAVDKDWLESIPAQTLGKVLSLQETCVGPDVDFDSLEECDGMMLI